MKQNTQKCHGVCTPLVDCSRLSTESRLHHDFAGIELTVMCATCTHLLGPNRCRPHGLRTLTAITAEAGFDTIGKFQFFGNDAADVESNLGMVGLTKADGLKAHCEIAAVKAAWRAISTFQVSEDKQRAESKLLGIVAPMKLSEFASARLSYERANGGQVHDSRVPGQAIIDALESAQEEGIVRAPRLTELPSAEETAVANDGKTDTSRFSMTWASSGVKVSQPVRQHASVV